MNSFPDSESEFCKGLFKKSKPSLYELANRLEIHSISKNFFTEIVVPLTSFFNSLENSTFNFICIFVQIFMKYMILPSNVSKFFDFRQIFMILLQPS